MVSDHAKSPDITDIISRFPEILKQAVIHTDTIPVRSHKAHSSLLDILPQLMDDLLYSLHAVSDSPRF